MMPLGDIKTSGPGLLLGSMSWPVALQQPGFLLISMAPDTTNDHANTWGLDYHPRPGEELRVMLQQGPNISE